MPKVSKKTTKKATPLDEEKSAEGTPVVPEDRDVNPNEPDSTATANTKAKADIAKEMVSDIELTRLALEAEEQVHFMIPLAQGQAPGAFEDMWTNGFYTKIPKGVMSVIPKSLAERLAEKYKIKATAGAEFRLDLNPDKSEKVS